MRGRFCFARECCELARNKFAAWVIFGITAGTSRPNRNQSARKRQMMWNQKIEKIVETEILEQSESNFDGDDHGNGFPARPIGRLESPLLHGFYGFFFQPKSRALHDLNFRGAAIRSDHRLKNDRALVFCLAGFFGIFRVRAIDTRRIADAVGSRMVGPAACSAAGTWAQAAAFAAANPCARAASDAAAAAGTA